MKFRAFLLAIGALAPVSAWAQGVIPTNNAAIFSSQPVQAPSGTTTATLATRSEDRLDLVADFGADPTGGTDISSALNAAIATGKPIFIPAGTFLLSGSVTDPGAEPVNITCSGQATTTINLSGSVALSQTGNFTIPFSIKGCGITFSGTGQISLAGTTYNNSQPLEGPVFQDDYFYVPTTYTGAGPVLNFAYVSSGNFINTNALVNAYGAGVLENFVEISGVSMNWQFVGNQWWDNVNPSNTANVSTGIFLNGSTGGGVQGTRISDSEIVGFSKGVYVGPNNDTVQITNSMLDQSFYSVYINGTGINDVRVTNSYLATSAAASSGSSAVYIGAGNNIKFSHNTVVAYNGGNYPFNLTAASSGEVTLLDNNTNGASPNNPNNVQLGVIATSSPIQAPNVLSGQIVPSSSIQLTQEQSGSYIFFTGSTTGQTITLPSSTDFYSVGGGVFYIENDGSVPVNVATVSTDYNFLDTANGTLGGSIALQPNQRITAISNNGSPDWISAAQNLFTSITANSANVNGQFTLFSNASGYSYPPELSNTFTMLNNISGTGREEDFFNQTDTAGAGLGGFRFFQNAGGTTYNTTFSVDSLGNGVFLGGLKANGITLATTPATATLSTNPPVSGTAYQWTGPGTLQLACPITLNPTSNATASVSLAIGATSALGNTMDAFSLPSGATALAGMTQTEKAEVPSGWYYSLTATNATIGTCAAVVH